MYYRSGVTRRNVYSSAVFACVDLLALKFYLDRVIPSNHIWHQKTRDGENRIPLRSLVLTQYRSVRDRRTDGQTDGLALAKLFCSAL